MFIFNSLSIQLPTGEFVESLSILLKINKGWDNNRRKKINKRSVNLHLSHQENKNFPSNSSIRVFLGSPSIDK